MGSYFISDIIKQDPSGQTLSQAGKTLDSLDDSITQTSSIAFQLDKFLQAEELNKSAQALAAMKYYQNAAQKDYENRIERMSMQDNANRFAANNNLAINRFNEAVRVDDFNMQQDKLNYGLSVRKQNFYEDMTKKRMSMLQQEEQAKAKEAQDYESLKQYGAKVTDAVAQIEQRIATSKDPVEIAKLKAARTKLLNEWKLATSGYSKVPKSLSTTSFGGSGSNESGSVATPNYSIFDLNKMYEQNPDEVKRIIAEAQTTKGGRAWLNGVASAAASNKDTLPNGVKLNEDFRNLIMKTKKASKEASSGFTGATIKAEADRIKPIIDELVGTRDFNRIMHDSGLIGSYMPDITGSTYRKADANSITQRLAAKMANETPFMNGENKGMKPTEAKLYWIKNNYDKAFNISLTSGVSPDYGTFSHPAFDAFKKLNDVLPFEQRILNKQDMNYIRTGVHRDKVFKKVANSKYGKDLLEAVSDYIASHVATGQPLKEQNKVYLSNGKAIVLNRDELEWLGSYAIYNELFLPNMNKKGE